MKQITFYFDVISPYAYLAFEQLPKALEGLSYGVRYRPVLFAAMLKHHGQLGPAEIAPKREWTYRQVLWLAHTLGIDMAMPSAHPFNPLPLLRLAIACSPEAYPGMPSRYVCETIFRHVWRASVAGDLPLDAADSDRFLALVQHLAPPCDVQSDAVKELLTRSTHQAMAEGVFGVPAFVVDDKVFWGLDSLPMLRAYLEGDAWFSGADWDAAARVGAGVRRQ
jgi:2-hydroxychromene-2-carboxylate isomerase